MGGVAHDGVADVFEVAAYLVAPTGVGLGQHQAGARAGVAAVAGLWQFQPVRRINSSRSRGDNVFFDNTCVANTNHRFNMSG